MKERINIRNFLLRNDDLDYFPGQKLIDAIEIAIALGKPLLITGEPGTGKTKFAYWLSALLAEQTKGSPGEFRAKPFIFDTKSTSTASDLFYSYDAVSHFGNLQRSNLSLGDEEIFVGQFIELKALGLAIAQTHGLENAILKRIRNYADGENGAILPNEMSSVVLVDEIDKAPREFPNDLLHEIENYSFEIKELNEKVKKANNDCRVVIILTSNDEKTLPNAFLRRCIFYHITFPDSEMLLKITKLKLGIAEDDNSRDVALTSAIKKFEELRDTVPIKKPGTAELLDWINFLYHSSDTHGKNLLQADNGTLHADAWNERNHGILIKTNADMESII